jgi:hypothetical protein
VKEARPSGGAAGAPSTHRPAFAARYPSDRDLDLLIGAFVAGDFARVRREAPSLADKSENPEVRAAALDLRRRIEPSPFALYLLCLGVVLLAYLYLHYWRR